MAQSSKDKLSQHAQIFREKLEVWIMYDAIVVVCKYIERVAYVLTFQILK